MKKRSYLLAALTAAVVGGALTLAACGGGGVIASNSGGSGGTSPAMLSAGDAPMSSVVAAVVTVSQVDLTSSTGTTVSLLTNPRKIELSHLGGVQEPLELDQLDAGTYNSISVTVSAAKITYFDSTTNQMVTADAVIPAAGATQTITLNPALTVKADAATDLRFDFDLAKSLDLTGTTVTFTPVISAAAANVEVENEDARHIHVSGTVTAIDTTANTLTVKTIDTGMTVTLNVTSETEFGDGMALNALQVGTSVDTVDKLNTDGSLTALEVDSTNGGTSVDTNSQVDAGLVASVTRDSNNAVTSFTMVVQGGDQEGELGQTLTVQVGSGTVFNDSAMAQSAGLASYDDTDIFPGAGVRVAGTNTTTANTIVATEIRPGAVNPYGLVSATPTTTAGGLTIPLLVNSNDGISHVGNVTAVTIATNSATTYDGNGLTATTAASLTVGTPIVAHGFLTVSNGVYTLFAEHVKEESTGYFD